VHGCRVFRVQSRVAGVTSNPLISADAYFSADAWHEVRITRRYDGEFTAYLDGVLVTASSGSNPFTDATTASGNYILINADAGDKIAYSDARGDHCFAKYLGELTP